MVIMSTVLAIELCMMDTIKMKMKTMLAGSSKMAGTDSCKPVFDK